MTPVGGGVTLAEMGVGDPRAQRRRAGLRQDDVAERARCSRASVQRAERGGRIAPGLAARIAAAYAESCPSGLLEGIPAALMTYDRRGIITDAQGLAADARDRLVGTTTTDFAPGLEAVAALVLAVGRDGMPRSLVYPLATSPTGRYLVVAWPRLQGAERVGVVAIHVAVPTDPSG